MSYLNNTEEGGSQTNSLLLMMVVILGGFALWTTLVPKEEAAPAPAAIEQPAEAVTGAGTSAPALVDTLDGLDAPTNAAVVAPFRIQTTDVGDGGSATFYVTNVGGRVASAQVDTPEQYGIVPGEREIFPSALNCDKGICQPSDTLAATDLPLALRIEGLAGLTETTVWAIDEDATTCTLIDGIQDCAQLVMNWTSPDGALTLTRSYFPSNDPEISGPFGLGTTLTIRNNSAQARSFSDVAMVLYGQWSNRTGGMLNQAEGQIEGMCYAEGRFRDRVAKKLEEQRSYDKGVNYIGINERYFVSAILPRTAEGTAGTAESCILKQAARSSSDTLEISLHTGTVNIAANSEFTLSHAYVASPKRIEFLKAWGADLQKSVKFGMFAFLAYGIRWLLVFFFNIVQNWGLAILLLTLAIKVALLPITAKSFRSMEKMKQVQPKIDELKKKYENDQQKLAEAQMKLFKEEGVNPLSGCLPLLLQMPIYFALYRTIFSSAELYHAPFMGWISDLSQRDPYFVLPALVSAMMLLQVKVAPQVNANPQMKMMQWLMPVMFIPVTLFLPAGLVLYIFMNILLSMAQQIYIRRHLEASTSGAVAKSNDSSKKNS